MSTQETAIYSVKPETLGVYADARSKMYNAISKWNGFISGVTFRSIEKETVFFDYFQWESRTRALDAAERVKKTPDMQEFLGCIDEIISYQHYEVDGTQPCFRNTDVGDVFEVALGVVDSEQRETFQLIKPELFKLVRQEAGLKEIASAQAEHEDGILSLDVLRWQTMDAASRAMENIHKTEQCGVFMATFAKDIHFDHMTKFA